MLDLVTFLSVVLASLLMSLISLSGALFLITSKNIHKLIPYWISFAAGIFLGSVFFLISPHLLEKSQNNSPILISILGGILLYFLVEKFLRWVHCHKDHDSHHIHPVGIMNLVGDAIHNFLDGIAIGVSFSLNINLGIITTFAIALHEIPQEISDLGVLLYAGFSKHKALWWNVLSSFTSLLGATGGYLFGSLVNEEISIVIMGLIAGGFLYIGLADIMPELHKTTTTKESLLQTLFLIIGIVIIFLLSHIGILHIH